MEKKTEKKMKTRNNNLRLINRLSFRLLFSLFAVMMFASAITAQTKLRDALDFDGDDRADYAVQRAAENNWYILRSGDNSLSAANFGINSYDTATPDDFGGDGRTRCCRAARNGRRFLRFCIAATRTSPRRIGD
ncbi:MAG TPA: hypothetical protein VF692_15240 [Pyrinomonadaceae bacterium]|jgi:hypothetical protein